MNKTTKYSGTLALGFLLLAGAQGAMAGTPDAASDCVVCHNDNGISDEAEVPTIAGASDYFLENQLAVFGGEARPCEADYFEQESDVDAEDHCVIASNLSEDEQIEVAAYFAAKPFKPAQQEVDGELAAKGASIHEANCERCHSDGGSLALDDAGILAGQWKHYLIEQFEYYKADKRWQPEKMQPEMDLSDEEMKALAEFYAQEGLKRFN
ncbi:hypothetical protein G4Y73_06450 [Wenzhouxiangella sp. XN201]|uniref:c-type cytochrome n=1 Tax=Wenzhouxiangella sp. XN201 TaxID=2710755 RepID=UPI0013CDC774|nr:c-type cytochrome [Wenzhouxiangella sp. XN201]NEZ03788.1 hypothetical protein [Wenzhouxiangella sp. XN201]